MSYSLDPYDTEDRGQEVLICEDCDKPSDTPCFKYCPNLGTNYDDMNTEV